MDKFDLIVVGAGPAGTAAAARAAAGGMRTLIIERAHFPRHKVCGDCLNPGAWEVLDELGASARIAALPSVALRWVDFVALSGRRIRFPLPKTGRPELGLSRQLLDAALLEHAVSAGAELWAGEPVTAVSPSWEVSTPTRRAGARFLVAADGRNSTVARLLGENPRLRPERIAWQTHFVARSTPHVALELHPHGYAGLATIGDGLMNLCLVGRPHEAGLLRQQASARFGLPADHRWFSIAPLSREAVRPRSDRLLYVGDAGRVVEPFTGEGILYALKTGLLAGGAVLEVAGRGGSLQAWYAPRAECAYAGRLWINWLARQAVLHPRWASVGLACLRRWPSPLRRLTAKVVG